MPGARSLAMGQYYAHPQNSFWLIMGQVFDFDPCLSYSLRVSALLASGVALWDVMQFCSRSSSLDADIVETSIVANDIASLLASHCRIERLYFNGAKAEQVFRKYVLHSLIGTAQKLPSVRLPSTSPAHARLSVPEKLAIWRQIAASSV